MASILIIEDEISIAELERDYLELSGFEVEIEDNGKGIATKDIPYIFDRFYRTDSSRNSAKGGSGIGLSIVRKILEDHGGKVWASSKEGTGTVVYFVLRKYQENVQNVESAEADDTDEKTKVKEAKTKEQKLTKESGTGKVVFTQDNSSKNSTHIMPVSYTHLTLPTN